MTFIGGFLVGVFIGCLIAMRVQDCLDSIDEDD